MSEENITQEEFVELGNKTLENTPYSLYITPKYHLLRIHEHTHNHEYALRNGPGGDIITNGNTIKEYIQLLQSHEKNFDNLNEEGIVKLLQYVNK